MDENPYEPPKVPVDKSAGRGTRDTIVRRFALLVAIGAGAWVGGLLVMFVWPDMPVAIGIVIGGTVAAAALAERPKVLK